MKRKQILFLIFIFPILCWSEQLGRRIIGDTFKYDGGGRIKVAFFDADSTLRLAPSGTVSASGAKDIWILPGVSTEIERLKKEGYFIAIVSNQGGVGKSVSIEDSDAALNFVREMVKWLNPNAVIDYYDFAEKYDNDRKPKTGMMERLEKLLNEKFRTDPSAPEIKIDKQHSFMCGDSAYKEGEARPDGHNVVDFSNSDRLVAENYGIEFKDPADLFHWKEHGVIRFKSKQEIDEYFQRNPQLMLPFPGRCPNPSMWKKLAQ